MSNTQKILIVLVIIVIAAIAYSKMKKKEDSEPIEDDSPEDLHRVTESAIPGTGIYKPMKGNTGIPGPSQLIPIIEGTGIVGAYVDPDLKTDPIGINPVHVIDHPAKQLILNSGAQGVPLNVALAEFKKAQVVGHRIRKHPVFRLGRKRNGLKLGHV